MSVIRIVLLILGTMSLILGIVGIFVPLLPTTPFLLLTAFLYLKSSNRAYEWLISQKHLGVYIRNYQENKIIPLRAKILSISLMWISIVSCVCIFVPDAYWWLKILLLVVSVGVTLHILSFKSK